MERITERVLWDALSEASDKDEIGLIIWPRWTEWENLSFKLHEGNEIYEFILKKVKNNETATITGECFGLKMTSILAVPVKAMVLYDKFFANILRICQEGKYHGPITLINSNELVECFL